MSGLLSGALDDSASEDQASDYSSAKDNGEWDDEETLYDIFQPEYVEAD